MEDNNTSLSRGAISFIGLATEFCTALEQAPSMERDAFIDSMLRLLPRLYIVMTDMDSTHTSLEEFDTLGSYIDEAQYEGVRAGVASLLGEDDTFLETFEQDMKYSDTPIAANISEGLADIYQDLFNFLTPVRDSEGALAPQALQECRENFNNYWSQTLVNVLRPLNSLRYS